MNRTAPKHRRWLLPALGLSLGGGWLLDGAWLRSDPEGGRQDSDWGTVPPAAAHFAPMPVRGLDDAPQILSGAHDQMRVLNFWARWCAPCRRELPGLGRLATQLAGESIALLAVALDDDAFALREYLRGLPLGGMSVLRRPVLQPVDGLVLGTLPQTWVVGRQGRVLARVVGARDWDRPDWAQRLVELDRVDRLQAMT